MLAILPFFLVLFVNPVFSSAFERIIMSTYLNDESFGRMGPVRTPKKKVHAALSSFIKDWSNDNLREFEKVSNLANLISSGSEDRFIIDYFRKLVSNVINLKKTCALLLFESDSSSSWAEGASDKMLKRSKEFSKNSDLDKYDIHNKIYSEFADNFISSRTRYSPPPLSAEHKKNKQTAKLIIRDSFEGIYDHFIAELKSLTDAHKGTDDYSLGILPLLSSLDNAIHTVLIPNLLRYSASVRVPQVTSYSSLGVGSSRSCPLMDEMGCQPNYRDSNPCSSTYLPSMRELSMYDSTMRRSSMEDPSMRELSMYDSTMRRSSMEEPSMREPSMYDSTMRRSSMEDAYSRQPSMHDSAICTATSSARSHGGAGCVSFRDSRDSMPEDEDNHENVAYERRDYFGGGFDTDFGLRRDMDELTVGGRGKPKSYQIPPRSSSSTLSVSSRIHPPPSPPPSSSSSSSSATGAPLNISFHSSARNKFDPNK